MDIRDISALFGISASELTQLRKGHINQTFLVTSETGEKFILQSLNREVFHSPESVMWNISMIESAFAHENAAAVPHFLECNGRNYAVADGEVWRMYQYAENADITEKARITGFAHGRFINVLSRTDIKLKPTIEVFHNYNNYVENLRAVSPTDEVTDRLSAVGGEISRVFADVPKRNIHGDAKADNIIIGEPCTIIDLDTAMYGYAAIDFGDMIRSADENDIIALTEGFAEGLDGVLTENEIGSLYYGIIWVTAELAARYLTDVYAEKRYFAGKTREQCRERADSLLKQLSGYEKMRHDLETIIKNAF